MTPFRQTYAECAAEAALQLSEMLALEDPFRSDALAKRVLALDEENEVAFERLIRNTERRRDTAAREALLRRCPALAARLGLRARTGGK